MVNKTVGQRLIENSERLSRLEENSQHVRSVLDRQDRVLAGVHEQLTDVSATLSGIATNVAMQTPIVMRLEAERLQELGAKGERARWLRFVTKGRTVVAGAVAAFGTAGAWHWNHIKAMFAKLFLAMLAVCLAPDALAHDDAEWIRRDGFKNAIGELCCGPRDCSALRDGDVRVTSAGYYIVSLKETVPFGEALPTPAAIGGYWRCAWGGTRRCFFAPPGTG